MFCNATDQFLNIVLYLGKKYGKLRFCKNCRNKNLRLIHQPFNKFIAYRYTALRPPCVTH